MEPNEQDLDLIERYLDGELAGAELQEFEKRLKAEPALAESLAVQQDIRQALGQAGRSAMKARIGAIGATVIAEGGVQEYQPSGRDSGAPGKSTFTTIIVMALALASVLVYQYVNRPEPIPATPPVIEDSIPPIEETPKVEGKGVDTVYSEAVPTGVNEEKVVVKQETILTRFQVIDGETISVADGIDQKIELKPSQRLMKVDTILVEESVPIREH